MANNTNTVPVYTIHVCPDCGEHITESEWSFEGVYYGHYHERPEDWPHAEDPWFDAVKIEVVPREKREDT